MIKTIVIDDEVKARDTILNMLKVYCPDVNVIATAGSVQEGVEVLQNNKPELLLLDIKMADGTGFRLHIYLGVHLTLIGGKSDFTTVIKHPEHFDLRLCANNPHHPLDTLPIF